jgi:hypothetical protein
MLRFFKDPDTAIGRWAVALKSRAHANVVAVALANKQARTIDGLPFVERRAADPMLTTHVGRLRSGLMLPQNPDDLFFREPARLHVHPLPGDGLYPFLAEISGLSSVSISPRADAGLGQVMPSWFSWRENPGLEFGLGSLLRRTL